MCFSLLFLAVRTDLARGFVTCDLQLIETIPWPLENKRIKSKYKSIFDVRFLSSHILQTRVFEMDLFHEGQYAIFGRGENNMLMKSSLAFNAVGYFLIMATYRNISSLLNHVIIIML